MAENYQVFISFKSGDAALARQVYKCLAEQGLCVFFSDKSLEEVGADRFKTDIDQALEACRVLVVIGTSRENLESDWVHYEWGSFQQGILSGRKKDGKIFVYLDHMDVQKLPWGLKDYQVFSHGGDSLEKLYSFICNALKVQQDEKHIAAPFTFNALHSIYNPPPDFTGRKSELKKLNAAIADGTHAIAIFGLGGSGKTTLALELAEQLAPHYSEAQILVNLRGAPGETPLKPAEAMAQVLHAFEPTLKLPEGVAEVEALYTAALRGRQVLLMLDNARDGQQVKPLLPPVGSLLLVTSRQRFDLPGLTLLDLGRMQEKEACRLLVEIAPRCAGKCRELARLCGCLPLALRGVGSLIKLRSEMSVEDVLERLQDGQQRLKLTEAEASLKLTCDSLVPDLQSGWRALAVFPGTFDLAGAAAVWKLEKFAAQERMGNLLDYSLVEYDEKARRFGMHDLAREYALLRLGEEEQALRERHAEYYRSVLKEAEAFYLLGGERVVESLSRFDGERENIEAGQKWVAEQEVKKADIAYLCLDYALDGGDILSIRLYPRTWIAWLERGLEAARALGNKEKEGSVLGALGWAYTYLGEAQLAIESYEQSLAIRRAAGDRIGERQSLIAISIAYAYLGEARQAIEYYEQSLLFSHETVDRRREGMLLNGLGVAYEELGQPRQAIEFFEKSLAISREIGDRRSEGMTMNNLGMAYADLGEPRRAIELYNQALVIVRAMGDRGLEGDVLDSLGSAYTIMGEPRRAIEFLEQALEISRQFGDRYSEANANWNLGKVYETQNDLERAIELMQASVDYERSTKFTDAEKHAAHVEELRRRLEGSGPAHSG